MRSELRSSDWGHMLFALSQTYGDNLLIIVLWALPKAADRLWKFVITLPYGSLKSHDHKKQLVILLIWKQCHLNWDGFSFFPFPPVGWVWSKWVFWDGSSQISLHSIFYIPPVVGNAHSLLNFNSDILSMCLNGNQLLQNLWHKRSLSRS